MTKEEIKKVRESKGDTQAQFAKKIGVHTNSVVNWENGKTSPMPLAEKKIQEIRDNG